mmetsp:Transcript_36698/g.116829  ORF Transcript_36698/g.116829 Transcript_36698/m.116829 type:complete len:325 (+) Transcript_36698:1096-2070(+)
MHASSSRVLAGTPALNSSSWVRASMSSALQASRSSMSRKPMATVAASSTARALTICISRSMAAWCLAMSFILSVLTSMRKVPNRIRSGRDRDTSSLAALHSPTLASIAAKPTADRSSGGPDAPASAKAAMYAASSRPMSSSYGRRDSMYSARGATAPSSCASSCARRAAVDGSSAARAHGSRFSSSASLLPPMSTSVRTASPARPSSTTRRHTATISAGCVEKASTRRASSASPSPTSPSAPGALAAVDSPRASLPSPPRSDPRSPPSSPASSPASSGVKSCTWMSSLNSGRTSMKSGSATRTGGRAMCSPMNSAYAASESRVR